MFKEDQVVPIGDIGLLPEQAAEHHGGTALCADTPWVSACRSPETVGDFAAVIADYADRLWAAGVRPGEVVAVVKSNHLDIQALQYAIIRIGALAALLSVRMEPADLLSCLKELQQPYLVTDAEGAEALRPWQEELGAVVSRVLALTPETALKGAVELGESVPHQVAHNSGSTRILITHSSGTTGKPKLVVHTVESLYNHVAPQVNLVQAGDDYTGISAKCVSFVHVRMSSALLTVLSTAVPFLGITSPDVDAVRRTLLRYRPQHLEAQPNTFLSWEPLARETPNPFSSVERYTSTFDALHPRTLRLLLEASDHPNPTFIHAYGQTESGPITRLVTTRSDLLASKRLNSRDVGAVISDQTEVRIVDDAGSPLPPGTPGHIEARTPARAEAVIGRPPLPGRDTWWPMGDIGVLRPDGHLELYDRRVDQVPGVLSTLRAEDTLLDELPELAEVVVVAVEGKAVVVASVVDGKPIEEDRWQSVRRKAGLPDDVRLEYRSLEELPVTGTVKVRRNRLTGRG